jgi:hypothetical protein
VTGQGRRPLRPFACEANIRSPEVLRGTFRGRGSGRCTNPGHPHQPAIEPKQFLDVDSALVSRRRPFREVFRRQVIQDELVCGGMPLNFAVNTNLITPASYPLRICVQSRARLIDMLDPLRACCEGPHVSEERKARGLSDVLRAAVRGAASGGAIGTLGGAESAALGAVDGAVKAVLVELQEQYSADRRFALARLEATEDASMEVPGLKLVVAEAELVARRLVDDVAELTRHQAHERVTDYARSLLAMTRAGEVDPDDFDRDDARQAVAAALRASVEATSSDVVPLLARLSSRPLDSFVRGVCRLLVEVDGEEITTLRTLFASAAQALPDTARTGFLTPGASPVQDVKIDPSRLPQARNEVELFRVGAQLAWHLGDGLSIAVDPDADVLRRLVAHRVASHPRWSARAWGADEERRVLRMRVDHIIALHFVLTGERVAGPTPSGEPSPV